MPEREYKVLAAADHRTAMRMYRIQNLIWVWLGLAAMTACITFLAHPAGLKITAGHAPTPLDYVWNIFFGLGGFLIAYGVWRFDHRREISGHILFTGGVFVDAVSILAQGRVGIALLTLLGVAAASLSRLYFLLRTAEMLRRGELDDHVDRRSSER